MQRLLCRTAALAWLALAGAVILAAALAPPPARLLFLHHGITQAPASAWTPAFETEDSVPDPLPPLAGRLPRLPVLRQDAPALPAHAAWPAPIPILLLTQRQNE